MPRADATRDMWWGEKRLAAGETVSWRIGPLELAVLHGREEWQIAYDWDPELDESREWELRSGAEFPDQPAHLERFVAGDTGQRLALWPALADRPVVSSPRVPLHLLPGHETTLYVGSPVWVKLEAGDPATPLRELPVRRPSDTWFGASTREGELCYATRTRALLNLDNLPVLHGSAVTPVLIRNQATDALWLEKLKLPVPLLSLFCDEHGRLWTESARLTRTEDSTMATLDVQPGSPAAAPRARLLSAARREPEPDLWIRAFGGLFG